MDEDKRDEAERLRAERRTWQQLLRQSEPELVSYEEGWADAEAYSATGQLRDRCREEVSRLDREIAQAEGARPPAQATRVASPTPERVSDAEDALADLSDVVSGDSGDIGGLSDAIAELSQIVSDIKAGSTETKEAE